jgi:hypothetical protein
MNHTKAVIRYFVSGAQENATTLFHWSTWRDFLRDQPGYRFRKLNERKK